MSEALTVVDEPRAISMFERLALDPSVDVDKLERLIQMKERIDRMNAEASFNAAFAIMQPRIPVIIERGKTDKGRYAELEDIIEAVRPVLADHGFALSHRTEWPSATQVRVVGVLMHRDGHHRTSEFLSGADTSGSKNAIQALGSSVSYGRRYTTKDLLCIVTRGEDNDGRTSEKTLAPDGYVEWLDDLRAVATEGTDALTKAWSESGKDLRAYALKHDAKTWNAIKAKAAAVRA